MNKTINNRPTTRNVFIDGVELKIAVREGSKKYTPLLFCNGIGANLELLNGFIEILNPEIGTISFDVPGIGGSPTPLFPYRMSWLADLLAKLLDKLGIEQVTTLGISWGGALAQEFTHRHPNRSVKLILAATSAGMAMVPGNPSVLIKMATPLRYLKPSYMMEIAPQIYGGKIAKNPDLLLTLAKDMKMNGSLGYFWQLLAGLGWTSIHWLFTLKQPALVMAGDEDPIVPLINAKILSSLIPNAKLEVFEGGGHMFMATSKEEAAELVEQFIITPIEDLIKK
ncbi:MAG: poly(3-hydroxyalkanoate) depolymerase [Cytophagales bacterium]|nr:MAG: poly(3-hydroxyalkanoate) depolymerase [Cytophagales bacterium]